MTCIELLQLVVLTLKNSQMTQEISLNFSISTQVNTVLCCWKLHHSCVELYACLQTNKYHIICMFGESDFHGSFREVSQGNLG